MRIRNLQSLLVCSIIIWESSLTGVEWISGWRSWLASRIQSCVWILTFTRYMRWCVFRYVRNPRNESSKRSVFLGGSGPILECFCSSRLILLLKWELWMILFSAEAIFASTTSKSGVWSPLTEHEDFRSSTDSTTSHFFDPQHSFRKKLWTSTYLSLEIFSSNKQTLLTWWICLNEDPNLQSLLVCSIILWRSSLTWEDWISGWRSWLASLILDWCLAFTRYMRWCVFWYMRDPRIWLFRTRCWRGRRWIYKKRFPIYHACPQMLGGMSLRLSIPTERLSSPPGSGWSGKKRWLTGNVGLSTAYWFSILKISRIIHTIKFIP